MSSTRFTDTQGQYLAFIDAYTRVHGRPPAETDMQRHFRVSPPSVHQMVLTLERLGLVRRQPGVARSIEVLLAPEDLPVLRHPEPVRQDGPAGTSPLVGVRYRASYETTPLGLVETLRTRARRSRQVMNREAYEELLANILRRNPNMTRTEATEELREMWGIAVDAAASRPEPALSTPKRTETKGEGDAEDEDADEDQR